MDIVRFLPWITSLRVLASHVAGKPNRPFHGRALQHLNMRQRSKPAKMAGKSAADHDVRLEHPARGNHRRRAPHPFRLSQQGKGEVSKAAGGIVAKVTRHRITFAGGLNDEWKEPGHLLLLELKGYDIGDVPNGKMAANPFGQCCVRPAPV